MNKVQLFAALSSQTEESRTPQTLFHVTSVDDVESFLNLMSAALLTFES